MTCGRKSQAGPVLHASAGDVALGRRGTPRELGTGMKHNQANTRWHQAIGSLVFLSAVTLTACGVDDSMQVSDESSSSSPLVRAKAVNLGTAGNYVILAKSGISTVPPSAILGNIGVSPIAGTAITGFAMTADATNVFSTSDQVSGKIYAADFATPTPANLTAAVGDMERAFTDAAGRAADVTELGAGDIGGKTLAPGVYKWSTDVLVPVNTNVTLSGRSTDVWIFQIAGNLTMASATSILLKGGALPKNVFWQVSGLADLGTTAHLEGVVLSQTAATLKTGASVDGRLLAQTAVTLDQSTVAAPR